jgi:microcystin-dependent protein
MSVMATPGTLKVKVGGVSVPVPWLSMPPGIISAYGGAAAPPGWLLCQGQSLPVASYPSLHAVIGYTYGGSGANFNLPDLRVRMPVGAGAGKALGSTDGLAEGSRNAEWSHTHNHTASGSSTTTISGGIAGAPTGASITATDTNHNHLGSPDHSTNSGGQGTGTRLGPAAGHGSTSTAVQGGGQVHGHGLSDPWHAHGHTIAASTSTTVTTTNTDSGTHPFIVLNYVIKE